MSLPKSIGAYADIRPVLDQVLEKGGGEYRLESTKRAYHWRARAYMLRKLLYKLSEEQCKAFGLVPSTPYDQILMFIEGNAVRFEMISQVGVFKEPDKPLLPQPTGQLTDLEQAALDLAKEIDSGN